MACGTEEFNNGIINPEGWLFSGIANTYTTASNSGNTPPSLKFDDSGDAVETAPVLGVTQLSFWIKGISTNATSSLLVEGFDSSWVIIENISNLPTVGTTKTYNNLSGYTKLRFSYTKSAGNLAFDDVNIICGSTVDIINYAENTEINIYPNPTNSAFTVTIPLTTKQINIFNSLGQLVKTVNTEGKTNVDFNIEPDGIYFVQIISKNVMMMKKVIVCK